MRNLCSILAEITIEAFCSFTYFIKSNLIVFANIISWIVPYLMYFAGQYAAAGEIKSIIGPYGEIFIPVASMVLIYYLKATANKIGKGVTIPVPDKRFTEVGEDGEVSVEQKRIQELILYMADLEDWMERKGML